MSNKRTLNNGILGSFTKITKIFFFILLTISVLFQSAWAGTAIIRLAWDPNQESDLAGYKIYYGTSPRTGSDPTVCGLCGYSNLINAESAPTIFAQETATNDYIYIGNDANHYFGGGYNYKPTVNRTITRVDVHIRSITGNVSAKTYNVKIYTITGASLNTLVGTSSNVAGSALSTGWNTFAFGTPCNITGGTNYGLVITASGIDASNYISISALTLNPSSLCADWGRFDSTGTNQGGGIGGPTFILYGATYRITGLTQRKTYYISATAYDTSNNESVFSDEISGPAKEVYINFDGDGKTDISVYHSASGLWFIKPSSGEPEYYVKYGGSAYFPVPGDYDGDGKTDIGVYHFASGLWYIEKSSDGTSYSVDVGGPAYAPVPGDYDGDGKTDIAVYHSSSGIWFIKPSSGAADYYVGYGGTGYDPVSGDFDGDGKTDIAVYHSSSGLWFIKPSLSGADYFGGYGGTGYFPVSGDYDGDGKTDTAVYHQATGLWFIKPSLSGADYYVGYGGTDYFPVPGDYDGDGKTDIAVYHSSSGIWFVKPSSGAADYYVGYGGSAYIPINLGYLLGWVY